MIVIREVANPVAKMPVAKDATATSGLFAGWWMVPGAVVGLGLWILIIWGIRIGVLALTGG